MKSNLENQDKCVLFWVYFMFLVVAYYIHIYFFWGEGAVLTPAEPY